MEYDELVGRLIAERDGSGSRFYSQPGSPRTPHEILRFAAPMDRQADVLDAG